MIIRIHKCPYLQNNRYCTHIRLKNKTRKKVDCNHPRCADCELWQYSSSDAERLILPPINPSKNTIGDKVYDKPLL